MDSKVLQGIEDIRDARKEAYGNPKENLTNIGDYWSLYILNEYGVEVVLTPQDVANMMALLKMARNHQSLKLDSYVDAANYLVLAGDVVHGD